MGKNVVEAAEQLAADCRRTAELARKRGEDLELAAKSDLMARRADELAAKNEGRGR